MLDVAIRQQFDARWRGALNEDVGRATGGCRIWIMKRVYGRPCLVTLLHELHCRYVATPRRCSSSYARRSVILRTECKMRKCRHVMRVARTALMRAVRR